MKVIIPDNWEGIKGIQPLQLQFKDTLPDRLKPKSRPINLRLWEVAEKEFKRLLGYFYESSRSPWASCLVVAPKATKPFIRFCGDYSQINIHIQTGHYTIPIICHELDKIIGHKIYLDIDLTNAFHQIPFHPDTSAKLSVQTPWGQYEPKFMPEGIGPGSAVLQETVRTLFGEYDWAIVIFDNMLILANDYDDAFQKLNIFMDKCNEHNVVLKFAKSWFGFNKVHFFGYDCTHQTLELSEDRKKAILDIPFPTKGNKQKQIRMLLLCLLHLFQIILILWQILQTRQKQTLIGTMKIVGSMITRSNLKTSSQDYKKHVLCIIRTMILSGFFARMPAIMGLLLYYSQYSLTAMALRSINQLHSSPRNSPCKL